MIDRAHRLRVKGLFLLGILAWVALLARLIVVQVIERPVLAEEARRNHEERTRIPARRGDILDRDLEPLGRTVSASAICVAPGQLSDPDASLGFLAKTLEVDEEGLRRKVSRGRLFYAARDLLPDDPRAEVALRLSGVGLEPEHARVYPHHQLAAHVVGFADVDNCGLEGVELEFDAILGGEPGWAMLARDAHGRGRALPGEFFRPPTDGRQVVLSVDWECQAVVEDELGRAIRETGARAGTVIVMAPETGDLLALANCPTYDPNRPAESPKANARNRAITDIFEPGSTFKIVTLAAFIRHGVVEPGAVLDAENGVAWFDGFSIRDHHPFGEMTFREAVEHSSNICFAKVARRLAPESLYHLARDFGLGCPTGVQLPGEVSGVLRPPGEWSRRSLATVAIGQEVAVTALQLASAAAAVANGGVLMTPRVALGIRHPSGQWAERFPPRPIRRVLSETEARQVTDYLVGVVERGTGQNARLSGLPVAGKTGTAEKAGPGGYLEGKYVASFVGYLPAPAPAAVILVVLDEPDEKYYGGEVAAPVFRRIVERLMTTRGAAVGDRLVQWRVDHDPGEGLSAGGVRLTMEATDRSSKH